MSSNPEPVTNQCDGCRRGLPERARGIHRDDNGVYMSCTADRYEVDPIHDEFHHGPNCTTGGCLD